MLFCFISGDNWTFGQCFYFENKPGTYTFSFLRVYSAFFPCIYILRLAIILITSLVNESDP